MDQLHELFQQKFHGIQMKYVPLKFKVKIKLKGKEEKERKE